MRVDVSLDPPQHDEALEVAWGGVGSTPNSLNLRENPKDLDPLEEPRRHPHLRSFLAAVNSADSVFASIRCRAGQSESLGSASFEFSSSCDLIFADVQLNLDRGFVVDSVRRIAELLGTDASADYLSAAMRVRPCLFRAEDSQGFVLNLSLQASGATPAQAELRWGFGLARVQQALLFFSRVVRHQAGH